jgi:hypothetical protein
VDETFSPIHLNHAIVLDFPFMAKNAYGYLKYSIQISFKSGSGPDLLLHDDGGDDDGDEGDADDNT